MDIIETIAECAGFDWDEGKLLENWEKHYVSAFECEQIFFNKPLVAIADEKHSQFEARFFALGRTGGDRYLSFFDSFVLLSFVDMSTFCD